MQKSILVIDDDPSVVESLSAALSPPYRVSGAPNTESALAFLETEGTSLIILDLVLGAEDGLDLLPRLRAQSPAPILLITGYGSRDNLLRTIRAKPDDFLEKPLDLHALRSRVAWFLEETTPEADPLERVRAWVARECHRPLATGDMASAAAMSLTHFCRTFQERFGYTPRAYLERCRMQRAAALLRDTDDPIKTLAGPVGFADANNFSTAFKRFYGRSPKFFRAECRPSSQEKKDRPRSMS